MTGESAPDPREEHPIVRRLFEIHAEWERAETEDAPLPAPGSPAIEFGMDDDSLITFRDQATLDEYVAGALDAASCPQGIHGWRQRTPNDLCPWCEWENLDATAQQDTTDPADGQSEGRVDLAPLDAEDLGALDSARTMTPLTLHMVAAAMVRKHAAARQRPTRQAATDRAAEDDEYEFHQCPHEIIRATCGKGGCTCLCDPCAPSRADP